MSMEIAKAIVELGLGVVSNKEMQKVFLGTYEDGNVRSLPDVVRGERLSPKASKKGKKKKKKKSSNFSLI